MRSLDLITKKNFEYLNIKNDVPGRPTCSSIDHPTSNISKFVDEHIKQYVPKTNSYVRDTPTLHQQVETTRTNPILIYPSHA